MTRSRHFGASCAVEDNDLDASLRAGERALFFDGDLRSGRKWFDAVYQEAERSGDVRGMARAALGLSGLWAHEHRTAADSAMVRIRQRRALRLLDPDSPLALRLRIRLAAEDDYRTGGHAVILALLTEARNMDDPVALAEALSLAHNCLLGPEHEILRHELAQDLIAEASRTGRRGDLLMGLLWQTADLFGSGDPHAGRRLEELRGLLAHDDHLAVGFVVSAMEVMLAIRGGRFEQAEAMAADCAERGAAAGDVDATGWYAAQFATIRWYQGRAGELVPALSDLVNSPTLSAVDNSGLAGLAVAAATSGDHRLATSALARLHGRNLAELPRSSSWLMSMYCVVEVAHLLDDAETARQAYTLLLPYARFPVIVSLGVACFGSVRHCLGMACLTTGDLDRAAEHLHLAVRDNLALGHWPATVLSRSRLSEVLALRDGPRDETARRELALAAREAATLGMPLPARARTDRNIACERQGRRWRIEMNGRTAFVEECVGMRHLAMLLANPGYEIPAVDLAVGPRHPDVGTVKAVESDQPVLDEVARRAYKLRLSDLEAEIAETEAMNDLERAAEARTERDWLVAELISATGMGGRDRRFNGGDDRARVAVGKAIRRALARVTEADPVIGAELHATVLTGRHCSYRP